MSSKSFVIHTRLLNQNLFQLRQKGMIPSVIYGQSLSQSINIEISLAHLKEIINTPNQTIFQLELDGQIYDCILRDFQTDRLHTEILHADFQYVKMDEIINMNIPMNYEGLDHLRAKKLILEKAIPKLPVRGPIQNLPNTFTFPVGTLNRGFKLFAHAVPLPENTELLLNPETIIATIQ